VKRYSYCTPIQRQSLRGERGEREREREEREREERERELFADIIDPTFYSLLNHHSLSGRV
jgi:hypothetical protein